MIHSKPNDPSAKEVKQIQKAAQNIIKQQKIEILPTIKKPSGGGGSRRDQLLAQLREQTSSRIADPSPPPARGPGFYDRFCADPEPDQAILEATAEPCRKLAYGILATPMQTDKQQEFVDEMAKDPVISTKVDKYAGTISSRVASVSSAAQFALHYGIAYIKVKRGMPHVIVPPMSQPAIASPPPSIDTRRESLPLQPPPPPTPSAEPPQTELNQQPTQTESPPQQIDPAPLLPKSVPFRARRPPRSEHSDEDSD